jgi:hypothetical protein
MTSELPSLPSMIPDPTHGEDSFSYNVRPSFNPSVASSLTPADPPRPRPAIAIILSILLAR